MIRIPFSTDRFIRYFVRIRFTFIWETLRRIYLWTKDGCPLILLEITIATRKSWYNVRAGVGLSKTNVSNGNNGVAYTISASTVVDIVTIITTYRRKVKKLHAYYTITWLAVSSNGSFTHDDLARMEKNRTVIVVFSRGDGCCESSVREKNRLRPVRRKLQLL